MNKKVFVDQPGYLGDIIFVMAIAQKYAKEGYVVDYPVYDEYLESPSIQKNFPTINFASINKFPNYKKYYCTKLSEDSEYIYLPFISNYLKNPCHNHMEFKYKYLNIPVSTWRNVEITRDFNAENKLSLELGIKEGEKYNLVNEYHKRAFVKAPIRFNSKNKNIFMSKIKGYNLFDWIGVMEKAESIHTVGTSIIFLMDAINTMPKEMHIYRRLAGDHSSYNYLLNKKYIYH